MTEQHSTPRGETEPGPLHRAEGDTAMRDGYHYDSAGLGVRADLVQAVLDAWARISPTGDPALTLRSVGDGAINRVDNIARLAVAAVADALNAGGEGGRPAVAQWTDFLRARLAEERHSTESAALALVEDAPVWWDLTEPGSARFGVEVSGKVIAPVLTGQGHWADHEVALHIVRNQPGRVLDELDAKEKLVDLMDHWASDTEPPSGQLLAVVREFAAPYRDHPSHPEYVPEVP